MKQIAIIGPTASGKSDLALQIAQKTDAYILSIDSLSIYKEIDIIAAKPSKKELSTIKHFGIDVLSPNSYFSVDIFIKIYQEALALSLKEKKNLIIVGGTSFYLKSLMQGLSELPTITPQITSDVAKQLLDLPKAYDLLSKVDPQTMANITPNDAYRIEKMLLIYTASQMAPSEWFMLHPPKPVIQELPIYNIEVSRDLLRERITKRTQKMLSLGAIDEVCHLERKYSRAPNAMGSIGIVEILEYLDGKVTYETMAQNITTHTAQLAKRQQTFNRTQFGSLFNAPLEDLYKIIMAKSF
jgi:tRNA dimethylallyltransferase